MEKISIYCTQLGMVIEFAYCMSVNDGLPCRNMVGCWKGRMDIVRHLRSALSDEELRKAFGGLPKSRIERIIEAIRNVSGEE